MSLIAMVEMCALEKAGRPDAKPIIWERLTLDRDGIDASKVTMVNDDAPLFKSGPRKGKPNWSKATGETARIVTDEEVAVFEAAWVERTGKCANCMGDGEVFHGWSASEGTKMKPCPRCGGSGLNDKATQ